MIIISISGIRGKIGESLSWKEAYQSAYLFHRYYLKDKPSRVVVCRDPKKSGEELVKGVLSFLKEQNYQIIYLGISTLPIIEWAVRHFRAGGGIIVTASHNPVKWNGIKFISSFQEGATILPANLMLRIKEAWGGAELEPKKEDKLPRALDCLAEYNREVREKVKGIIEEISGEKNLGEKLEEEIRRRYLRVGLDATCWEGAQIPMSFLSAFGISEVKVVNNGSIENCPRSLEPAPKFLNELRDTIQRDALNIGFATDPDQDRLVAIPLSSEEHTPLLCGKFLLELGRNNPRNPLKKIVVNLSTTSAWEEIAEKYGVEIVRVPVGEINVVEGMKKAKTFLGMEGNGGVILSSVNYGRNSTVGMALLLFYLAWSGRSILELEKELPPYYMIKDKIEIGRGKAAQIFSKGVKRILQERGKDVESLDTQDGYKILFKDSSWVHLRPSNTEPIVRIFGEKRGSREKEVRDFVNGIKAIFLSRNGKITQP